MPLTTSFSRRVYPHRHIFMEGAMVASVTPSDVAASTHNAAADETESEAALLASYRSLHSSVLPAHHSLSLCVGH